MIMLEQQLPLTTVQATATSKDEIILKKPSRLAPEVTLKLHTSAAQQLFISDKHSSNKYTSNLLQFGGRMTDIWLAAKKDDPYADWFLLKAYDQIVKLRAQLTEVVKAYQAKLDQANAAGRLDFQLFAAEEPTTQPLHFSTQYGFLAASLVADYDVLMRIILTARHLGVLLDKPYSVIQQQWKQQIIGLFRLPFQWKPFAINRKDMENQTEQAKLAQAKMGELPEVVLKATLRAPFAPLIQPISQPIMKNQ